MDKELKLIVDTNGKEVFADAEQLMQHMRQAGCTEKEIMTTGLILKACPSVGRTLAQDQVTQAEVNVLVSTAVVTTGLSIHTVRLWLSSFLRASGVKGLWVPHLMIYEPQANLTLSPMILNESETVEELAEQLREDKERSEVIHDLDSLSQNGNIRASYALGQFYKEIDDKYSTENGMVFFQRAASQGYGPANGALADYEVRSKRKNIPKAAKYFENPTSISGADGREWSKLSAQLLDYLEDNSQRVCMVLRPQILMLALTVAALLLLVPQWSFWNILCCLIQLVGLGWTLFARLFRPYSSCRTACYGMILSWILLVLSIL